MYIYAHIYIHKMNGNTYDITVGRGYSTDQFYHQEHYC